MVDRDRVWTHRLAALVCLPGGVGPGSCACALELDRLGDDENVYYQSVKGNAVAKCVACGDTVISTVLIGLGIGAVCAVAVLVSLLIWRKMPTKVAGRITHINFTFKPANKLKIVLVFTS